MTQIRLLQKEDLGGVAEIEELCFSEPWSQRSLELLLEENNFGVVVLDESGVVAYGGMTCVLDEGSVTNIAVRPEYRRKGFGRAILDKMIEEATARGMEFLFLEVRVSNAAARSLYLSAGFSECGISKSFYRHPTEDAVRMAWKKQPL